MSAETAHSIKYTYLYRVLRPDEDPAKGLKAASPNSTTSISDHVAYGSKRCTQFISTSADKGTARKFANLGMQRKRVSSKRIVTIDVEKLKTEPKIKRVVDLTNSIYRSVYCSGNSRAERFAETWCEVIIEGEIPAICIVSVETVSL